MKGRGGNYKKFGNQPVAEQAYYSIVDEDKVMEEESIFAMMEESPGFKGGEKAFKEFLEKNLLYPLIAKEKGIEGTVYVEFIVNKDGTIESISIIRSVSKALDDEAIRVVKLTSGKWKPGKQNGKAVKASMIVPVKFKL